MNVKQPRVFSSFICSPKMAFMSRLAAVFVFSLVFISNVSFRRCSDPVPTPWPLQFHSILFMNYSGSLELIDLWYDWPNGRNFNIIQSQQGKLLYDLEWNNGTSFVYTLDSARECSTAELEVGILRPNWLDGADYLGQRYVDGFLCNVWEKVEFIWYYEDVLTRRPVHWVFYTGREAHLMTFEEGAVLEDLHWQAPVYCFDKNASSSSSFKPVSPISSGALPQPQLLLSDGRFPINVAGF